MLDRSSGILSRNAQFGEPFEMDLFFAVFRVVKPEGRCSSMASFAFPGPSAQAECFRRGPCSATTMTKAEVEDGQLMRRFPKMPSGDAQRTWFPEMVVRLRSKWHEGVSMPTRISFGPEDVNIHASELGRGVGSRGGRQLNHIC